MKNTIRSIIATAILALTLVSTSFAGDRIHVKVLKAEDGTAQGAEGFYTPTRITIQMPDGTIVLGSCVYKWGTAAYHPCAYPLAEADAEIKKNSIDLFWSASLDGKKTKTERYKIEQVIKP